MITLGIITLAAFFAGIGYMVWRWFGGGMR